MRVKFLCYEDTMQAACLRLKGKKLLVALTIEGKFADEGLQNLARLRSSFRLSSTQSGR